jgi:transposase
MSKKMFIVSLSDEDRQALQLYVNTGIHAARSINRARILLLADTGLSDPSIAKRVGVCKATVFNMRRRYCTTGLKTALDEKKRPGSPRHFTGRDEANLTVLACSNPPTGAQRWTVRLLADKLIELGTVETISHMTVQRWLKKTT